VVAALIRCSDMLGFGWLCCGRYAWQHFISAIVGGGGRPQKYLSDTHASSPNCGLWRAASLLFACQVLRFESV